MSFTALSQKQGEFHRISHPVQYQGNWISPFIATPNEPNSPDYIKITGSDESNVIASRHFKILTDFRDSVEDVDSMETLIQPNNPLKGVVVLSCCNAIFKTSTLKTYILGSQTPRCPNCRAYNFKANILNIPTFKPSCANEYFLPIFIVASAIVSVALVTLYFKLIA